jgi:pimeloyl-ACP methyl ester carboxylesterase
VNGPERRRLALATGLTCHLLEWPGHGPDADHTVVLMHGFLDHCWGWERVASALGSRFHVLAPDVRGHGDSDRVGAGGYYHFMDYVADLASLVDQLGRAQLSLVGHSMGGSICSYYAGAFPDRVTRLALLEGTGPPEDPTPMAERVAAWITAARRARERSPRRYPDVAAAAQRLMQNDSLLEPALAHRLAEVGTTAVEGGIAFKHDPLHLTRGPYPFRVDIAQSFWQRLSCPVLLVEGELSSFRHQGREAEVRARAFAAASRVTLPGAGHMMQRHQPAALAKLLTDFLA